MALFMGFLCGIAFAYIVSKALEMHKDNKNSGSGTSLPSGGDGTSLTPKPPVK